MEENRFAKVRKAMGLTVADAADISGVCVSTIRKYEGRPSGRNGTGYDVNTLVALADAYQVSVDYLLGRVDIDIDVYKADIENIRKECYERYIYKSYDNGIEKDMMNRLMASSTYSPYPYNLVETIFEVAPYPDILTPDQIDGINWTLKSLTDRECQCVAMIFRDHKTLDEVGKHFHLTRERIRQIVAKAIRKLRHPSRARYIKDGLKGAKIDQEITLLESKLERLRDLEGEIEYLESQEPEACLATEEKLVSYVNDRMHEISFDSLELSVRPYNCIARHLHTIPRSRITVADVFGIIFTGKLPEVRNLGKKSYSEVIEKFRQIGVVFEFKEDGSAERASVDYDRFNAFAKGAQFV